MSNQFFQCQHYSTLVKLSECLVGEQGKSIKLVQKGKHDLMTRPFNQGLVDTLSRTQDANGCNHAVLLRDLHVILDHTLGDLGRGKGTPEAGHSWTAGPCFDQ